MVAARIQTLASPIPRTDYGNCAALFSVVHAYQPCSILGDCPSRRFACERTQGRKKRLDLDRASPRTVRIYSGRRNGCLVASPCAFSPTPCCRLNRCCDQGIQAFAATMSFFASGVAFILSLSFAFASAALVQPRNLSTLVVCGEIASAISSASDVFYPCRYYRYVLLELMLTAVLDDLLGVQWNLTTQRTTTTGHSRAPSYPSVQ